MPDIPILCNGPGNINELPLLPLGESRQPTSVHTPNGISIGSAILAQLMVGWWRGTVVERRSLAGELSLSCARPAADG